MGEYTSRAGMYKPGGGSTGQIQPDEVVDIDRINANMDIIDRLLGVRIIPSKSSYVGDFPGDLVYALDDQTLYLHIEGSGLSPVKVGEASNVPMIPTVVVTGTGATSTVDERGVATVASATTVTLDKIFDAGHANTTLYYDLKSSATGNLVLQFTIGVTPQADAQYNQMNQTLDSIGNPQNATAQLVVSCNIGEFFAGNTSLSGRLDISGASKASRTRFFGDAIGNRNDGGPRSFLIRGEYATQIVVTGVRLSASVGTVSGTVRAVGVR